MLNDVEVRLYDKLPSSWAEWEKPQHVLPLLGTRSILEKGQFTIEYEYNQKYNLITFFMSPKIKH